MAKLFCKRWQDGFNGIRLDMATRRKDSDNQFVGQTSSNPYLPISSSQDTAIANLKPRHHYFIPYFTAAMLSFGAFGTLISLSLTPLITSFIVTFLYWHLSYTWHVLFQGLICDYPVRRARLIEDLLYFGYFALLLNSFIVFGLVRKLNAASFNSPAGQISPIWVFMQNANGASILLQVASLACLALTPFRSALRRWADGRQWRRERAAVGWAVWVSLLALAFRHYHTSVHRVVEVPVARLPACLDGFRIAMLADVHAGTLSDRAAVEEVVAHANALEADAVVVVGDISDGTPDQLGAVLAPLAELWAPSGKFFVTGNHEGFFATDEGRGWEEFMAARGFEVLSNGRARLGRAGGDPACSLDLLGVRDPSLGGDLAPALEGLDGRRAAVLLSHQPKLFGAAAAAGVGLTLAGHTHGGAVFPLGAVNLAEQGYVAGLFREGDALLYVSEGTVGWGYRARLLSTRETTEVVLRAPGAFAAEGKALPRGWAAAQWAGALGAAAVAVAGVAHCGWCWRLAGRLPGPLRRGRWRGGAGAPKGEEGGGAWYSPGGGAPGWRWRAGRVLARAKAKCSSAGFGSPGGSAVFEPSAGGGGGGRGRAFS